MSYADPRTLLAALIGAPALPGARCRGKPHLFDAAEPGEPADLTAQRHTQALGLCQHCTALASCTEWFDTLPRSRRPIGIVAGRDRTPKPQQREGVGVPRGSVVSPDPSSPRQSLSPAFVFHQSRTKGHP